MTPRPESNEEREARAAWSSLERPAGSAERGYSSARASAATERSLPFLDAASGAAFERQLLLAEGPADETEIRRRAGTRRGGRLILGTVLAIVAAIAGVSYARERKAWEDKLAAVEGQRAQHVTETAQRLDALRQEAAEKDRIIAERRADNQKLAALMDKTLVELKASLETMRGEERERSERTETALKKALEHRVPPFSEVLRVWIPEWLRR